MRDLCAEEARLNRIGKILLVRHLRNEEWPCKRMPDTPPQAPWSSPPGGGVEIELPSARLWLACGFTDMRRGFDGLAARVQSQLEQDPFLGQLFVFRVCVVPAPS